VCIELGADPDCRRSLRERVRLGLLGAVRNSEEAVELAFDAFWLLEGNVVPEDLRALRLARTPALPTSELARLIRTHILAGLLPRQAAPRPAATGLACGIGREVDR
jgi:hypothetical protein